MHPSFAKARHGMSWVHSRDLLDMYFASIEMGAWVHQLAKVSGFYGFPDFRTVELGNLETRKPGQF